MKKNKVAVYKTNCYSYPDGQQYFRPSVDYPEYPFKDDVLSPVHNECYHAVRETLGLLGLDKEHFGTFEWNPFGSLISPGQTVLIKPNLVMDRNISGAGEACLYTQPAVVAPVIDYVCIALKDSGKIIVGDAPMQECRFDILKSESGYDNLIKFYQNKGIDIEMVDFRELTSIVENGVHKSIINPNAHGTVIDLAEESEFYGTLDSEMNKMRITNYDPRLLASHHTGKVNEYYVSDYILKSDVVINMPKPKSHRKAGATISLKNFVGINVRKEYLPHHTIGSLAEGGDEYLNKSTIHKCRTKLIDIKNELSAEEAYTRARLCRIPIKACSLLLRLGNNKYSEGSWYGNHTISRTISDLNKIVLYADKNGRMQSDPQRKIFIIADMIVSGEKEGPVCPSPKNVGIIAAGVNPVAFDMAISSMMGFDHKKIPAIVKAQEVKGKYKLIDINEGEPLLVSNEINLNKKKLSDIKIKDTFHFIPSNGWKGHIELGKVDLEE